MSKEIVIKDLKQVTIRFSGDSGDGMQLTGTLFSTLSAVFGNEIATFPDYPSEIRAPQGTLSGVSGFQVRIGSKDIHNAGDKTDVLIAMNPAALKLNSKYLSDGAIVIYDTDSFTKRDLTKALFETDDPFEELGLTHTQQFPVGITSLTKSSLEESGIDNKAILRSKNMLALGLVCWLFNRPIDIAKELLADKFKKRPKVVEANIKVLTDGYNYGHNLHLSATTYRIETLATEKGYYTDINGNKATSYGLMAAAEKAGVQLFLGSYPITPATDILQELSGRKDLGVKAMQMEDEIAGICTAVGASFAGSLAATSTSGPGLALKSEALGLAVMTELPLVVINVQRGGPSTGLPTKSEQTDLRQALYGRNGESPLAVVAATSPTDCFDSTYWASKIALEHMTPVVLLTDGYIANGASAWKIPNLNDYPDIQPRYAQHMYEGEPKDWRPYVRDEETLARYWGVPGTPGFEHRVGGLEKDYDTGVISTEAKNHQRMVDTRHEKIERIANSIPEQEVLGNVDADTLIVGWGGTYGHLYEVTQQLLEQDKQVALAHFKFINPLPRNTYELLKHYKTIIVAEQNSGHFASFLLSKFDDIKVHKFNRIEGQPFSVKELVDEFSQIIERS